LRTLAVHLLCGTRRRREMSLARIVSRWPGAIHSSLPPRRLSAFFRCFLTLDKPKAVQVGLG
jgi:hypothetical protein